MNLYRITEFNDENSVVLITLYYLGSIYLYLGNPPFLTLTQSPHQSQRSTYELSNDAFEWKAPQGKLPFLIETVCAD